MPSSPIFQMSSCLTGGGGVRSYRLDLDIVAKSSSSPSPCSSTSSPSSTLSESSNSTALFISTKRARAPRKRPNQCSAEAAALLSSIYPKLFSSTNLPRQTLRHQQPIADHFPVLLPSFPIPRDDSLLLHNPSSPLNPPFELKPPKVFPTSICSPPNSHIECPQSPNFDAESILDEEVEEGIDSILGNLSMSKESSNKDYVINPYLAGVMRFKSNFGFGFGISSNTRCALRHSNDGEWWRSPTVAVTDIAPKLDALSKKLSISDKKKKKKKKKVEKDDGIDRKANASSSSPKDGVSKDGILKEEILKDGILKPQLGLKLNYDRVLNAWTGPPPFSGDTGSPETAADVIARITEIDLFPDAGGGLMREASVQRYKEKRRNRLYSKKIRYEVRKANADQRPRMKASGRFVRTASLFKISMAEGSH